MTDRASGRHEVEERDRGRQSDNDMLRLTSTFKCAQCHITKPWQYLGKLCSVVKLQWSAATAHRVPINWPIISIWNVYVFTWVQFSFTCSFVHPMQKACTYVHCVHSDLSCRQCILLRIAARRRRWWHASRHEPEPKPEPKSEIEQHAQFSIKDTHLYFTLGQCICIYSSMDCINEQSSHSSKNYLR